MPDNTYTLTGDTDALRRDLEELRRQFDELTDSTEKNEKAQKKADSAWVSGAKGAGKLAAGLLAVAAATKKVIDGIADTVDETNTLAASTGLSNEQIAGLRFTADSTSKSLSDLVPNSLAKKMADAANGSEESARLFRQLGIEVTDANGQLRAASDVFPELIGQLTAIEDPTTKAALASALLEEQGKQLLSAFSSTEDFDRFIGAAKEFGVDVGPEAVQQTSRWQQANAELGLAFDNVLQLLQRTGVFEVATKFVKDLAIGTVFLTEVTAAFVSQSLGRLDALKDAFLAFPDIGKVFDALIRSDSPELQQLFEPITQAIKDGTLLGAGFDPFTDAIETASGKVESFFKLQTSGAAAAGTAIDTKLTPPVVRFEGALKAAAEAQKLWLADSESAFDLIDDAEDDLLTAVQRANLEYINRIDIIQQLAADAGLKAEAELAAEERLARDLAAIEKQKLLQTQERLAEQSAAERQHLDNVAGLESAFLELRAESFRSFLEMSEEAAFSTIDAIGEVITNLAEAEKERLEAQLEGTTETIDALKDERTQLQEILSSTEDITDEERAQAEARLAQIGAELESSKLAAEAERGLIDEQNARIMAADALSRTAAIGQIAIDGARAFTSMVAFLAGIVGPAAPAVAAPIVGGVVALQTAAVLSAPKPTLHDGGVLFGPTAPDERDIGGARVLNGEVGVVLNQRAVDLGALDQVESLNRAADLGGQDQRMVLANAGRVIGEATVRQMNKRGSALNQVVGSPSGFANPHQRR